MRSGGPIGITVTVATFPNDVLKFFGFTLTGGDAAASSIVGAIGGFAAGFVGAGTAVGAANLAALYAGIDPKTKKYDPTRSVYFDHFVPFITYKYDTKTGSLLVGNILTKFLDEVLGFKSDKTLEDYKEKTGIDLRGTQQGCGTAANDNAWPERAFCMIDERMAA